MQTENPSSPGKYSQIHGLTAIELLLTLTAIAIVILITVPVAPMLIDKFHLWSTSSDLLGRLELAREEAELRSSTVRICPSSNGLSCRRSGGWENGWLVFSDGNGNGSPQEIEVIHAFEAPHQSVKIIGTGAVQTMASFNSTGLVPDHGSNSGEFMICIRNAKREARALSIDREGWVQLDSGNIETCKNG